MELFEITTMTSKGQVVIPREVRHALALDSGTKFVVVGGGDTIILKKLEMPSTADIKALLSHSRRLAKKAGFKKTELAKLIKAERNRM